jgi:putative DNA primase/helicase
LGTRPEIEVLPQDNPTAELYTQKGELEKWVQATNKLIKYPAVRFKLYTACVPPLLKLLNIKSFVETQQTPSGRLKTTMGLHGAFIWGNPERLQLNAESTAVGILKTVEFCTDLPIFVDETSITDKIKELVYLVANGVGRSKGNTDGGLVMPSTWSTVLLTTGEKPILPESALTGQQVRVLPLRDGVTEKLPALTVKEIQNGITTNYGHVGVLFMQELFKEKENLISLFNSFFNDFPEVEDITSDRAKEYYAAVALAGYLLEIVFEKIGVTTQESSIVCKKYFTDNVISNSFMPDHIKALSTAYSWFSANEVYFQDEDPEHPLNHERYGWIRDDKKHGSCVCFIPDKLSKYLNTEIGPNTYEAVTDEWKALNILIPKEQINKDNGSVILRKKNQISAGGAPKQVIKIPRSKFEEYLKLEKEENLNNTNKSEHNNKPQPTKEQAQTALKAPSESAKVVTSLDALEELVGITASTDNIIIADNDTELAELMKQEGF